MYQEVINDADFVNQDGSNEKFVHKVSEVLVFPVKDDLPFNLPKVTASVLRAHIFH